MSSTTMSETQIELEPAALPPSEFAKRSAPPQAPRRRAAKAVLACASLLIFAGVVIGLTAAWRPIRKAVPLGPLAALSLPLPSNGTELTFFLFGSCADQFKRQDFWSALTGARALSGGRPPQLLLFNGDLVYGDCARPSCPELPAAWERLFALPEFVRAASTLPMAGLLDDHDYGENDADARNQFKGYAKSLFLARFGVAPDDARWSRPGLYTADTYGPPGRRVQILRVDTRWFRSPFQPTDCYMCPGKERYVPYPAGSAQSAGKTMLGEEQWAWLERQLEEPAEIRLIVSTVQVLALGHGWECWGMVPDEVTRLIGLIRRTRASGVVLLSGDRHIGGVYKRSAADPAFSGDASPPYDLYEVTSSSLTHSVRNSSEVDAARVGPLYHENNFGAISIDWGARSIAIDVRTSDACGTAPETDWTDARPCAAARATAVAGRVLRTLALSFDQLQAPS